MFSISLRYFSTNYNNKLIAVALLMLGFLTENGHQ